MCREHDECGLSLSVVLLRLPWYFLKESLRSQGKEDGPQAKGAYCSPSIPNKSTRVVSAIRCWRLDYTEPVGTEVEDPQWIGHDRWTGCFRGGLRKSDPLESHALQEGSLRISHQLTNRENEQ